MKNQQILKLKNDFNQYSQIQEYKEIQKQLQDLILIKNRQKLLTKENQYLDITLGIKEGENMEQFLEKSLFNDINNQFKNNFLQEGQQNYQDFQSKIQQQKIFEKFNEIDKQFIEKKRNFWQEQFQNYQKNQEINLKRKQEADLEKKQKKYQKLIEREKFLVACQYNDGFMAIKGVYIEMAKESQKIIQDFQKQQSDLKNKINEIIGINQQNLNSFLSKAENDSNQNNIKHYKDKAEGVNKDIENLQKTYKENVLKLKKQLNTDFQDFSEKYFQQIQELVEDFYVKYSQTDLQQNQEFLLELQSQNQNLDQEQKQSQNQENQLSQLQQLQQLQDKNVKFYEKLQFHEQIQENFIYGINQTAVYNIIQYNNEKIVDKLLEFRKNRLEFHFSTFQEQFQQSDCFQQLEKNIENQGKQKESEKSVDFLFISQHSNLGKVRFIFSSYFNYSQDFCIEGFENQVQDVLKMVVQQANQNCVQCVILPLEFLIVEISQFNKIVNQNLKIQKQNQQQQKQQLQNQGIEGQKQQILKQISQKFRVICQGLKRNLIELSSQYDDIQFLKKIHLVYQDIDNQEDYKVSELFIQIMNQVLE
ncbi:hypothetical protein PPERSA_10882 [Pseudocohnilembus persalinus]|uniref:Uncharacterized protein n=1 Tax=Pseudocohnilembus persalinus TaxID=266149 RepID=A0A0V0R7R6_PSEPJ|nr:hypothetical protein PPERSA_10882 [Pseudocohnilembus persalinus]|eukprot:KRX10216.1 hypothetical protein PPERSA_10882 [Pseudocohnilembus persalinus]